MKKLLIHTTVVFVLSAVALALSPEPQFGRPKEQQDHSRTLSGRVFNRQDEPIEKAVVYLKNTKNLVVKTYITDPDGTYRFPALSPNVDYEVYAEHNGARSDTKTLSAFDSRKQVNITLRIR